MTLWRCNELRDDYLDESFFVGLSIPVTTYWSAAEPGDWENIPLESDIS